MVLSVLLPPKTMVDGLAMAVSGACSPLGVTTFEGPDAGPVPALLVAVAVNV